MVLRAGATSRSRCRTRRSTALVDALSRYLRGCRAREVAAPCCRATSGRWPASSRCCGASRPSPTRPGGRPSVPDPQELRRRAFAALRELLARLGDRRPLVLSIDDLQWGDVDSAALLAELLRPPDPPGAAAARLLPQRGRGDEPSCSESFAAIAAERRARPRADRELAVEPLTPAEARDLALTLLGREDAGREPGAAADRPGVGGQPVLRRRAGPVISRRPRPDGATRSRRRRLDLDEVLWARIRRLPDEARRLLEVVAVSGRPLGQADACRAAGLGDGRPDGAALLRSAGWSAAAGRASATRSRRTTTASARRSCGHLPPAA